MQETRIRKSVLLFPTAPAHSIVLLLLRLLLVVLRNRLFFAGCKRISSCDRVNPRCRPAGWVSPRRGLGVSIQPLQISRLGSVVNNTKN